VQHALRAFTPRDQKAVKAAGTTFRLNPAFDIEQAITQLAVGEALVSFLDEQGSPTIVERAFIRPPHGQIGAITPEQRANIIQHSTIGAAYDKPLDRESAQEVLKARADASLAEATRSAAEDQQLEQAKREMKRERAQQPRRTATRRREPDSVAESVAKSAARAAGSQLGRSITRGILGGLFGGRRR
jgi:hypothetical protein